MVKVLVLYILHLDMVLMTLKLEKNMDYLFSAQLTKAVLLLKMLENMQVNSVNQLMMKLSTI